MPRFLHTYTGEFHWVADPSKIMYAILSHTWQPEDCGGEQSYAAIQELQAHDENIPKGPASKLYIDGLSDSNAHPGSIFFNGGLSDKIKNACKVAREAGYQLIWIDSGCIDKSSSAELAEAINSMFELYRLADVCYVYLADVPEGDDPRDVRSHFRESRWHARGWTLQELIAPKDVVFLTKSWNFLGTKNGLASVLEEVTRIDADILIGRAPVESASVARRMSWAATRETTRVEDEAYSLLGIFGVHLSPIYGEGRNAFLRLQEEILKYIPDQTIFAWGDSHEEVRPTDLSRSPEDSHVGSGLASRSLEVRYHSGSRAGNDPIHWHSLLAPSPVPFLNAHNAVLLPPTAFAERLHLSNSGVQVPPLRCVLTPQGVGLTLLTIGCAEGSSSRPGWISARDFDPVYRFNEGPGLHVREAYVESDRACHRHTPGVTAYLALLQCEATSSAGRFVIALALLRPTSEVEQNMGLHVATRPCHCDGSKPCRLVYISLAALDTIRRRLVPTELNLRRTLPPPPPGPRPTGRETSDHRSSARIRLWPDLCTNFCVAPWCEERLGALGFVFSPLQVQVEKKDRIPTRIVLTSSLTSQKTAQSTPAQGDVGAIEITLSLTRQMETCKGSPDTICHFSIRNSSCDPLQDANPRNSAGVKFHTHSIQVTLREHVIHEVVVVVTDIDIYQQHSRCPTRRLLRLSLECPPDYLYAAWGPSNVIDVPCLWISMELSDVFRESDAPSTTHSSELSGQYFSRFDRNVILQGLRGRLGPLKRFLGNTGLLVLRQLKKIVESVVRARRRKAEGSPSPSHWQSDDSSLTEMDIRRILARTTHGTVSAVSNVPPEVDV